MKITKQDYAIMRDSIKLVVDELTVANVMAYKQKLKSGEIKCYNADVRLMYDLKRKTNLGLFISDVIYKYADDSHVQTALLAIGRELLLID